MTADDMVVVSIEPVKWLKVRKSPPPTRQLTGALSGIPVYWRHCAHTLAPRHIWAQAGQSIPATGTTHADYSTVPFPAPAK